MIRVWATVHRDQPQETRSMMDMQELPVVEAFYKARFIGNRWQMSTMLKYGV